MGTQKRERQKANRQLKQQVQVKQDKRRFYLRRAALFGGALVLFVFVVWLVARGSGDDNTPDVTIEVTTTAPGTTTPGTIVGAVEPTDLA